jgi:hypothetical protein
MFLALMEPTPLPRRKLNICRIQPSYADISEAEALQLAS